MSFDALRFVMHGTQKKKTPKIPTSFNYIRTIDSGGFRCDSALSLVRYGTIFLFIVVIIDFQNLIEIVNEIWKKYGLNINRAKTKLMVISRSASDWANLKMDGRIIQQIYLFKPFLVHLYI